NLVECINNARDAAMLLGKLHTQIEAVDGEYLEASYDMIVDTMSDAEKDWLSQACRNRRESDLTILMHFTKYLLQGLSLSLSDLTDRPQKDRERGKPALPYVYVTLRLMRAWSFLTGEEVAGTKDKLPGSDTEEDEGWQPSTEFIRLVLKMIDPKITLANAKTCI